MFRQKGVWLFLASLVFWVGTAAAQVTTGTILGTVSDSTGAVIPGATVTVRNVDTGISRTVTTDAAGRFRAPQLGLGSYEVTAESAGFQTAVRSGITLTIGREAVVDFTMQVGAVAERITVTGEAPLLETTNATVASLVDEKTLRDLPLSGRSFTDLTVIQPGVVDTDSGGGGNIFSGGARITMGGARPQQSLYLIDGTDVVAPYMNVTPESMLGEFLGVDTIREYSVIQTNAGAQYGRALGGIVNAVTRSGTNELHGSAFHYFRNENLNANDFFLNRAGVETPVLKRNQFGATLGGPIKKDSTFFFLSYEGLRQRQGSTTNTRILTAEAQKGIITACANPPTCNEAKIDQIVTVHPDIKPILPLSPLSNLPTPYYDRRGTTFWTGSLITPGSENYSMARIDQRVSDNVTLFGRVTIDNSQKDVPTLAGLVVPGGLIRPDRGAYRFSQVEYTQVFTPTLLNTVRAAFNRNNIGFDYEFDPDDWPSVLFLMPDPRDPTGYARDGLPSIGGAAGPPPGMPGLGGGAITRFVDNTYSIGDTVNWSPGAHAMTMGGSVTRYQSNADTGPWGWGDIRFTSEPNFLRGIVNNAINPIVRGDYYRGWRQTYGALFIQDDWNVRPGLTVNVGLRWERVTGPKEVNDKMAGVEDILKDTTYTTFTDSLFHLSDPLKGLSPRIGFAWTPFANQKTVFRGAFGTFKEILLLYQYQLAFFVPPWAEKFNMTAPIQWPDPIATYDRTRLKAGEPNVMDRNMDYPYNIQWNFTIEHQLTETLMVGAAYVGTRSIGLVAPANMNQNIPVKTFDPTLGSERWFTPVNAQKPNPVWPSTRSWHNLGDAYYNSLQVQVQQRYSSGLNYKTAYTWSKNIDTVGTGNKCAETIGGTFYVDNIWDVRTQKGLSALHTSHNLSISAGYELPFGAGKPWGGNWSGLLNALASGWQVNGILTTRTGLPMEVYHSFDQARNGASIFRQRPDLAPGASNNPVLDNWKEDLDRYFDVSAYRIPGAGWYGNLGRDALISPGKLNLNLSIFKGFDFGESKNLQFRAEFFNAPNHPNFGNPGQTVFTNQAGSISAGAGQITSQSNNSREIQLALKLTF